MKYKKKPIVVEAIQWDGRKETWERLFNELGMTWTDWLPGKIGSESFCLNTSVGLMLVSKGDFVIKEPFDKERKLYPCKPDIFKQTYEKTE